MDKARKAASDFRRKYGKSVFGYDDLADAAEDLGYTLVGFNNVSNDGDVALLSEALGIQEYIARSRGFTYADGKRRLIFVHEGLSDDEKKIVLAHEIGHVVCGHLGRGNVIGNDVKEENEANEFSHYLLSPSAADRGAAGIGRHKKLFAALVAVLVAAVAVLAVLLITNRAPSYYATTSGNKYHAKDCSMIAGNTNVIELTEEQVASGKYEPCALCLAHLTRDVADPQGGEFGEFYVTGTGTKYHRRNCARIKNNSTVTRMTKEQFDSGKYEPCDVCLPQDSD